MLKKSICVCDEDVEYIHAFAAYLLEHIPGIDIYIYTSEEAFLQSNQVYAIGILSKDFLGVLEYCGRDMVEEKFYLCDDQIAKEYEHLPMVYKYQSMEIVEEMLKRFQQKRGGGNWFEQQKQETKVYGIYSPIGHELQLPFALSYCQILREKGSVLFLDVEGNSILGNLISQNQGKNMLDMMYLLVQGEKERIELADYVNSFMGVDYIRPFHNPEEFHEITEEHWQEFMLCIYSFQYDFVVVLFGQTMKHFISQLNSCQELILLNKPGDFYQMSQRNFLKYVDSAELNTEIQQVFLPMSAGNLVDGTYVLEELVQGNLGVFVRRQMEQGIVARSMLHATG